MTASQTPRLTFLSSTVNGYEGTGRALSLKLIAELRNTSARQASHDVTSASRAITGVAQNKGDFKVHEQRWVKAAEQNAESSHRNGTLVEMELGTPIRYAANDPIEAWLHTLLCLTTSTSSGNGDDVISFKLAHGAPSPSQTSLYAVNRTALFSYHTLSEQFLQKCMCIYSSA
jgi:N-acetyltransferase 10